MTKQTITLFIILSLLSSVLSVALTFSEQNYTLFGEKIKDSKPKETKSESKSDSKPKDKNNDNNNGNLFKQTKDGGGDKKTEGKTSGKDNNNNKDSNIEDNDASNSEQQHEVIDKPPLSPKDLKMGEVKVK